MSEPTECSPRWADRGWYLAVEFRQSSSPKFESAVRMAGKHPGFTVLIDEGGNCIYRTLYRPGELKPLPRLLSLIRAWKETRLYVCGHETTVEAVETWLPCYQHYEGTSHPPCREPLRQGHLARRVGCHWAGISLEMSEWDAWYRLGTLDADGVFHLNREALSARIHAWERSYAGCPLADGDLLRRVVAALPDTIDPRTDKRWTLRHPYYSEEVRLTPQSTKNYADFLREVLSDIMGL